MTSGFINNQIVATWKTILPQNSDTSIVNVNAQNLSYYGEVGPGASTTYLNENYNVIQSDLSIFPNPVVNDFNLQYYSEINQIGQVRIFDILGKMCFSLDNIEIKKGNISIMLSPNLNKSTYKLDLILENYIPISKLFIVK
jgi:hypothetical protein